MFVFLSSDDRSCVTFCLVGFHSIPPLIRVAMATSGLEEEGRMQKTIVSSEGKMATVGPNTAEPAGGIPCKPFG